MADDGSAQSKTVWPLPKFYFQVKWGDQEMSFQEVSGLVIIAKVKDAIDGLEQGGSDPNVTLNATHGMKLERVLSGACNLANVLIWA